MLPVYSKSLLIFIHKITVLEKHRTTGEIRELLQPRSTPTEIPVYFYTSSFLIYILEIHRGRFQTGSDVDSMENDYMFVMLWNLSVISHMIFPKCLFLFLAQNLKITKEAT